MDFLYLLLDPLKCKTMCFLCCDLKVNEATTSIYETFEIRDDYSNVYCVSLLEMINTLLVGNDVILNQVCNRCTDLVINMYVVLQQHKRKKVLLNRIVDMLSGPVVGEMNQEMDEKSVLLFLDMPITNKGIESEMNRASNNKNTTKDKNEINDGIECYTKDSTNLDKEKAEKVSNKSTVCHTCGKAWETPYALRIHLNSHKQKQCPYCSKMLSHSHYCVHVKNHTEVLKRRRRVVYYNCQDCSYRSLNKTSLEAHVNKIHLVVKPYQCQICSKSFYKRDNLTQHIRTHDKNREHNELCPTCGEHFVSKRTLLNHMKLHSNNKQFVCKVCGKKFVSSGQRLEHFKRNHSEKLEVCFVCGKNYGLKKDLTRHMKINHGSS